MSKSNAGRRDSIPISEFKAKCIEILKNVNAKRKKVVVTLRGKPLATVEPYREPTHERRLGRYEAQTKIVGDVVHFDWSDDWESR